MSVLLQLLILWNIKMKCNSYIYENLRLRVCILAFFIQHTNPMRYVTSSFVACQDAIYFSTLSHMRHDFRKIMKREYLFWSSLLPGLKHFRYVKRHIVIIVQRSSGKVWLFYEFCIQWNFLLWCSKKLQKSKVMSVQPVWSGSFFQEWQTWGNKYSFLSILL